LDSLFTILASETVLPEDAIETCRFDDACGTSFQHPATMSFGYTTADVRRRIKNDNLGEM